MLEPIDRRDAAIQALRQALRHAGHVAYGAASELARSQSPDTIRRVVGEVVESTTAVTKSVNYLTEVEKKQ